MSKFKQSKNLLYIVEFKTSRTGTVIWVSDIKETSYRVGDCHSNWVSCNNDEYWQEVPENLLKEIKWLENHVHNMIIKKL